MRRARTIRPKAATVMRLRVDGSGTGTTGGCSGLRIDSRVRVPESSSSPGGGSIRGYGGGADGSLSPPVPSRDRLANSVTPFGGVKSGRGPPSVTPPPAPDQPTPPHGRMLRNLDPSQSAHSGQFSRMPRSARTKSPNMSGAPGRLDQVSGSGLPQCPEPDAPGSGSFDDSEDLRRSVLMTACGSATARGLSVASGVAVAGALAAGD
jgi:hypothetical protein